MAMTDPRDPRTPQQPSVQESMAELSRGLGAFLTRQDSMMAEMLAAQKDFARSQQAAERMADDRLTVMRGGAGLPPPAPPGYEQRMEFLPPPTGYAVPNPATRGNPALSDPSMMFDLNGRTGLMDFSVDGGRGKIAEQSRSGIKAGVYTALAGKANTQRHDIMVGSGFVFNPVTGGYLDPNGNEVDAPTAAAAAMSADPHAARNLAMMSTAARVANSWNAGAPIGRSLMSALPGGLIKGAGIAGAAYAIGNQALDFYQGEVGKINAQREIYGDISVGEAYGMRAEDWINDNIRGRFSSLGSGAYKQLSQSGRQLALKGGALDDYIGTGADIMGMGVSGGQTSAIMKMIIEAGNGLEGLADSLKTVNDAAKEAGTNAGRARDIFMANYEASSNVMFGSGSATRTRTQASLTSAQVNQGREFQSVSYAASFNDPNQNRMTAASAGISNTEMLSLRQTNPTQAMAMDAERQKSILIQIPTGDPGKNVQTLVNEFISMNGGYDPQYDQDALGAYLLQVGGIDPLVAQQYLASLNIQTSQGQALGVFGQFFTSESTAATFERESNATREGFTPGGNVASGWRGAGPSGDTQWAFMDGQNFTGSDLKVAYAAGLFGEQVTQSTASDLRAKLESGEIQSSPVAESLINSSTELGLDANTSMVRVRDGEGYRVVSMAEALRYYPDQIQGGTAKFVEGVSEDAMNRSVADVVGLPTDMVVQDTESYASRTSLKPDMGVPFEEWKKRRDEENRADPDNQTSSDSKVTFELTPEARRLLQPVGGTDPYMVSEPGFYSNGAED